jgi:hypothetical protein
LVTGGEDYKYDDEDYEEDDGEYHEKTMQHYAGDCGEGGEEEHRK